MHAVVRGSALNQDGKTSTVTSPSLEAQVKLIEDCYRRAGISLADVGYVEAHMTGTATGVGNIFKEYSLIGSISRLTCMS